MADVIAAMQSYGFPIRVVSEAAFAEALRAASQDPEMAEIVLGLTAYESGSKELLIPIGPNNRFTTNVLYRLGFKWPITDDNYLTTAIRSLDTLQFFM